MTAQTELPQAETTGSCCGGGGCSSTPATDAQGSVTTVYQVTGMSCGHCEGAISAELSELPGVTSVKAVASTGQVTVISDAELDDEAVRAAIDEAGYELTGRA